MNPPQNNPNGMNQTGDRPVQARQKPVLTQDELRVLKECNRESFWYRCVPAAVVCIGTTQVLVNRGIFKPHPKYGSLFKNMGAGLVAYFLGKLSYQEACREKIKRLENSPMAEALRRGKRGTDLLQEMSTPGFGLDADVYNPQPSHSSKKLKEEYGHDLHIDSDSYVQNKGLDDANRPSLDSREGPTLSGQNTSRSAISYDELRKQNREIFQQQRSPSGGPSTSQDSTQMSPPSQVTKPYSSSVPTAVPKKVHRNQYGDIVED